MVSVGRTRIGSETFGRSAENLFLALFQPAAEVFGKIGGIETAVVAVTDHRSRHIVSCDNHVTLFRIVKQVECRSLRFTHRHDELRFASRTGNRGHTFVHGPTKSLGRTEAAGRYAQPRHSGH